MPRASEYDSVAIEGAPPPDVDSSQISQRMLIMLTEKLAGPAREARTRGCRGGVAADRQRRGAAPSARRRDRLRAARRRSRAARTRGATTPSAHLTPEQLLAAANAATQASAGATDFEGDETPVVAINRPLLEAYNAMWDASRALEVGEPGTALPPMRLALAAIQRARNAERLYLRGKAPVVVVDIEQGAARGQARRRDRHRANSARGARQLVRAACPALRCGRRRARVEPGGGDRLAARPARGCAGERAGARRRARARDRCAARRARRDRGARARASHRSGHRRSRASTRLAARMVGAW